MSNTTITWHEGGAPVERRHDGSFPSVTSVGAYPIIYITRHNDTVCAACVDAHNDGNGDWNPVVIAGVYYEGADKTCEECGEAIPSAYGDPDA